MGLVLIAGAPTQLALCYVFAITVVCTIIGKTTNTAVEVLVHAVWRHDCGSIDAGIAAQWGNPSDLREARLRALRSGHPIFLCIIHDMPD